MSLEKLSFKERIDIISNSSSKVNGLFIIFILYGFYVFIVAHNVNDLDLFINGSTIKIPIVSYNIDTLIFYKMGVTGLILIQIALFLSLNQYLNSINSMKISKNELFNFTVPFLFNRFDYLSTFLKIFLLCIFPTTVYVWVFISFLPYHGISISIYHFIIILINVMIWIYYSKKLFFVPYRKIIIFILNLILIAMIVPILSLSNLERTFDKFKVNKEETTYINKIKSGYLKMFSIDISDMDIVLSEIRNAYNNPSIILNFNSRDLRYLNLYNSILMDVDFKSANISNANFSGTQFNNITFKYSNMENSNFDNSILKNCEFGSTKLANSTFIKARLTNINFISVINFIGQDISKLYFKSINDNLKKVDFAGTKFDNVLFGQFEELKKVKNLRKTTFINSRMMINTQEFSIINVKDNRIYYDKKPYSTIK